MYVRLLQQKGLFSNTSQSISYATYLNGATGEKGMVHSLLGGVLEAHRNPINAKRGDKKVSSFRISQEGLQRKEKGSPGVPVILHLLSTDREEDHAQGPPHLYKCGLCIPALGGCLDPLIAAGWKIR